LEILRRADLRAPCRGKFEFAANFRRASAASRACVTSCADTADAPAIKTSATNNPDRDLVLIYLFSLSFSR